MLGDLGDMSLLNHLAIFHHGRPSSQKLDNFNKGRFKDVNELDCFLCVIVSFLRVGHVLGGGGDPEFVFALVYKYERVVALEYLVSRFC